MDWLEVAAFLVAVIWFIAVAKLGVPNEWHHEFVGVLLFIIGNEYGVQWLAWGGFLVMLDDSVQHVIQCWRPAFRSPLFRLYAWAYPVLPAWLRL